MTVVVPKPYAVSLPGMNPRPCSVTLADVPSEETEFTVMPVTTGTISSGKVPSVKLVFVVPTRP